MGALFLQRAHGFEDDKSRLVEIMVAELPMTIKFLVYTDGRMSANALTM
jgi:hypothetical protein